MTEMEGDNGITAWLQLLQCKINKKDVIIRVSIADKTKLVTNDIYEELKENFVLSTEDS